MAVLFSSLFLLPMTKSSIKRWIDDIGAHLPSQEEMVQPWLAILPATECHLDGDSPRGTDNCVRVVQDEHERILMPHEVGSEHGVDARPLLQTFKAHGLNVTAAVADSSHSVIEAINAV